MLGRMLAGLFLALLADTAIAEDWTLVKDAEGIGVYLRPESGSAYEAYRGVTTVAGSVDQVRAFLDRHAGDCSWVYRCESQRILSREGNQAWVYMRFDMPWPVSPRDSIMRVTWEKKPDGGIVQELNGDSGRLPEVPGYIRVSKVEGSWQFTPLPEGGVRVIYEAHSEPGGSLPSWLANRFVVDAPFETLRALRERLAH